MITTGAPSAVVILTGDELLQGRVRDTNGPFLTSSLVQHGYSVRRSLVVADDRAEIADALRSTLAAGVRLVVLSGGLGTTHDDLTMAAVGEALGRRLVRDEEAWELVRRQVERIARRRRLDRAGLLEQAERQAFLPEGARCVTPAGLAPGAVVTSGESTVVVLPGVPRELEAMWPPIVESLSADVRRPTVRLVRLHGVGEMQLTSVLEEAAGDGVGLGVIADDGLDVGITAGDGEIAVRVAAYHSAADARAAALVRRLAERLPVFSADGRSLDEIVAEQLRCRRWTVAVAESCTAGLLGARLTRLPGSSDYFVGGVLSYSDELKRRLLSVPADTLRRHGAVSAPVAEAMAHGCRRLTGADVALAVTGIAGPGGGSADKPVGLVFLACAGPRHTKVVEQRFSGDREAVRAQSVTAALHLLRLMEDERSPDTP